MRGNKINHPKRNGHYKPLILEHKVCSKCKRDKKATEFTAHKHGSGRLQSWCKTCKKEFSRTNRHVFNGWVRENVYQRKKKAVEYKGGKCARCGRIFPVVCYDFHHIDPKLKVANIARMITQCLPWEKIKAELDKCILTCANCHRIIERGERS